MSKWDSFLGALALSGSLSFLFDELIDFFISELLELQTWGIQLTESWKNLLGIFLFFLFLFFMNRRAIVANIRNYPLEDAQTKSNRKVFVSKTIDLSKVKNHDIFDSIFIDCDLVGDCLVHLHSDVSLQEGFELRSLNREKVIYESADSVILESEVTIRSSTLLKSRIRVTDIVMSNLLGESFDRPLPLALLPDRIKVSIQN